MDFISYVLNNLHFADYLLLSYIIFVCYYNECVFVYKLEKSVSSNNNNKSIINKIKITYTILFVIGFTIITLVSYYINSILLLFLSSFVIAIILPFIFLAIYKVRNRYLSTYYVRLSTYYVRLPNVFISSFINLIWYILIRFLIIPANESLGYVLLCIFIILRTIPLILPIFPSKKYRRFEIFKINISSFLFTLLNTIWIILILFFSFSFSIQYKTDFEKKAYSDENIVSIKNNIRDFNSNIDDLSKSLLHLYSVQKNTQEKLDSLHILFNNINQDLEVISLKKVRLEEKINYLQNKTEEDVKQEAVYVALNEIFNKNQYIGILISLIIGVITGYVANLLTRKKDMEATRQLYEENLYHSQKHKQIQNE